MGTVMISARDSGDKVHNWRRKIRLTAFACLKRNFFSIRVDFFLYMCTGLHEMRGFSFYSQGKGGIVRFAGVMRILIVSFLYI